MGNYDTRSIVRFRQSVHDFPLTVSLGEKVSAWGLSRWAGSGLRFIPPDDEGFTLRGDRQRLIYKGWRRSHRFAILGDTAFEYDCILEKEPESNVITLLVEGAKRFDFFRQPDFVKDLFLKGELRSLQERNPRRGRNRETLPYPQAGDYRQPVVVGGGGGFVRYRQ